MFSTVSAYLDRNKALYTGIKAVNDTVVALNSAIARIADKMRRQQTPTAGTTDEKGQVRLNFEEKILEVADQLAALADAKKDMNMAAQVELTLSALDKLADDDLEETGKRVSALAVTNLALLADYGIVQVDVTALDALTTKFHGVKSAPRTAIAGRAGETETLPVEISNTTSLLRNRLDKLMTRYKKTQPEFFAGYRSAHVIVDRGGSGGGTPPAPTPPPAPWAYQGQHPRATRVAKSNLESLLELGEVARPIGRHQCHVFQADAAAQFRIIEARFHRDHMAGPEQVA